MEEVNLKEMFSYFLSKYLLIILFIKYLSILDLLFKTNKFLFLFL